MMIEVSSSHAKRIQGGRITRKYVVEDICIGRCAECAEDVVADFYNDNTVRVGCAHAGTCTSKDRHGDIEVQTSVGFEDEEFVSLHAAWPDIDWTQQGRHVLKLG